MPDSWVTRVTAEIADLDDEELMRASRVTSAIICTALLTRFGRKHESFRHAVSRDAAAILAIATGAVN